MHWCEAYTERQQSSPYLNVAIGRVLEVRQIVPVADVQQERSALLQHLVTGLDICNERMNEGVNV